MVDTFPVNGSDPFRAEENNFHVSRAAAIQAYAKLEQALCSLFALLLAVGAPEAGIVFFKIVNAKSRLDIIEKLKKRKLGGANNLYFNSLLSGLKQLDGRRNQLVHWHEHFAIRMEDGAAYKPATLEPPNFWIHDENTVPLTHADLIDFAYEADFYTRATNTFTWHHEPQGELAQDEPWLSILARPLAYPPPEDHPLYAKRPAPPSQPGSSRK